MPDHPIDTWHRLMRARDARGLDALLNDGFRYVRALRGDGDAVLEFELDIEGIRINGVDIIRWNDDGLVTDFKVMLRPLKAVNLIHEKMAAMLAQAGN